MKPLRTALGALVTLALIASAARAVDLPAVGGERFSAAPSATATTVVQPATPGSVEWTLSGAAGPVIVAVAHPSAGAWPLSFGARSFAWQVDLQRQLRDKPFLFGAALEGTYDQTGGQQLLGAHAFAGTAWRQRHWSLEATVGGGLEAAETFQAAPTYHLGIYGQGTLMAAAPITGSLELLLKLGVHLTASHDEDWFAATTFGVRYRLP